MAEFLEQNYEEPSEAFSDFVEGYASGRTDAALNEMILQLYEFSRSYPWPEKWLDSFVGIYRIENQGGVRPCRMACSAHAKYPLCLKRL